MAAALNCRLSDLAHLPADTVEQLVFVHETIEAAMRERATDGRHNHD